MVPKAWQHTVASPNNPATRGSRREGKGKRKKEEKKKGERYKQLSYAWRGEKTQSMHSRPSVTHTHSSHVTVSTSRSRGSKNNNTASSFWAYSVYSRLSNAKLSKVLCCQRTRVCKQLELDPPHILPSNLDVKKDNRVGLYGKGRTKKKKERM